MLYKSRRYLYNRMDFNLPINFVCKVPVYFAWSFDNFISIIHYQLNDLMLSEFCMSLKTLLIDFEFIVYKDNQIKRF